MVARLYTDMFDSHLRESHEAICNRIKVWKRHTRHIESLDVILSQYQDSLLRIKNE